MSRTPPPRADVTMMGESTQLDPQIARQPVTAEFPEIGEVTFHQASSISILEQVEGGQRFLSIAVARPGCRCGCGAPGDGLIFSMPPDAARDLAAGLVRLAGDFEAAADKAAAAAIARARAGGAGGAA